MAKKIIWLIYGILTSLALVAAGVLLMIACYGVYTSGGPQIYTAEKVAAAFAPIAIVVYAAGFLVVGGLILHLFLPMEQKRRSEKNYVLLLRKLHFKNDLSDCGDRKLVAAIEKQSKLRNLHSMISFGLLVISGIVFLVYACNGSNFHSTQITESMIRAMYVMIPCLAVPFGYGVFTAYFHRYSIRKELELMKLVAAPVQRIKVAIKEDSRSLQLFQLGVLMVAVVLIVVGVIGSGYADVLTKAVNICRECVGLG